MEIKSTHDARAELQAWYLRGLLPKLGRAAERGALDPREFEALDGQVRSLIDLPQEREEAA